MLWLRQVWALALKDLTIFRRRWISTVIRALIVPVVLTFVLTYIKYWTATPGIYGIGSPSPIMDLSDALQHSSARPRVIIIDNGLNSGDIGQLISALSDTFTKAGKDLHILPDNSDLMSYCPSSNAGVSNCFGAVEFNGSPDHGASRMWNYTLHSDAALADQIDVSRTDNDIQVYLLPLQRAISSFIAQHTPDSPQLPPVVQFPFTDQSEAQKEKNDALEYSAMLSSVLAFAFFIGLSPLIYHCAGHLAHQREQGMSALIDAMMPVGQKWKCMAIRAAAAHLAFDIVYLPGWLIMGGLMKIAFPLTNVGYLIALYVLTGLAITSYSVLAGSLFRKVQLSGIAAIVTAIALAVVAQLAENPDEVQANPAGTLATGLLFSPSAFVYALIITSIFESQQLGLDPSAQLPSGGSSSALPGPPPYAWSFPFVLFIGFLIVQIFLYPTLAVIIEYCLHGTSSSGRTVSRSENMDGRTVRIRGFSQKYRSLVNKKATVQAVDNLSLDLHPGTITILLGANGSGKSTTLTSIAGLQKVGAGSIEIDGTGGLGICPQQNILWEYLTVEEHVRIFNLLKATKSEPRSTQRQDVTRLIDGCDLAIKRDAMSKTLSGGQKRKLQLAIMLAGGSRVCCIDEATSGVDPLARRRIWDILMAERGQRSILLTTHFLDEAEVLSDHVVVLSKGVLKAQGTVASLKAEFGGGFKVILGSNSKNIPFHEITNVQRTSDYDRAVFMVPDSAALAALIAAFDQSTNSALHQYTIHGPTIEEIFLALSDEMQGDSDWAREVSATNAADSHGHEHASDSRGPVALALDTGVGCTPLQQTFILFHKRLTILKHNFMPYVSAIFVSLVVASLVTLLFKGFQYPDGVPCSDPNQAQQSYYSEYVQYLQGLDLEYNQFVYGPPDRISPSQLSNAIPSPTYSYEGATPSQSGIVASIPTAGSLAAFDSFIGNNVQELSYGGIFNGTNGSTLAWSSQGGPPAVLGAQSLIDGMALGQTLNVGYTQFTAKYTPLDITTSIVAVFTVLGFAIYPGLFALYPTAERLRHVRAMQYSNGIKSSSLWIAYALFDLMFILLISVLSVIIWATQWQGWYALPYMFVVFFLYGLTATAFSYVVSLFVTSQLAAFAATAVIQVVIAMLFWVGYAVTVEVAPVDQVYNYFNYIYYTIAVIAPVASLFRGVLMVLNHQSLVCVGTSRASYPGAMSIYGAPILYLTVQFFLLVAFLMFWESGRSLEVFGITFGRKRGVSAVRDAEKTGKRGSTSSDASEDAAHMSSTNSGLRVANLSKSFGSNKAVDDVTFGILPSEKFALLGPNGAGKSTTISLIRGDLKPDRGSGSSVHIGNQSLYQTPVAAKNQLGVCPQFDATDTMTLREHLIFYARARGVPNRNHNIEELIRRLGLGPHANKLVKKLSGGTHRKLSLAIALLANPRCLLLDEPSSGMDPAAKRALWHTLRQIASGRVLLLTTHSMEEAAALCDRAGILAGELLALGTIEQLRRRHGPAACVYLVHRSAPHASAVETQVIRDWVLENFPNATFEGGTFGGQVRFSLPRRPLDDSDALMGQLFRKIEAARASLGVVDYSIGPATLDQVFLDVIQTHGVQEENTQEKASRKWFTW